MAFDEPKARLRLLPEAGLDFSYAMRMGSGGRAED